MTAWKLNRKTFFFLWIALDILVGAVVACNHAPLASQFERYALAAEQRSNGGSSFSSILWSIAAILKPDTIGREEQSLLASFESLGPQNCDEFAVKARAVLAGGGDAYYLFAGLGECAEAAGDVKSAVFWTLAFLRSTWTLHGGSHDIERSMHDSFHYRPILGERAQATLAFIEAAWAFDELDRGHHFQSSQVDAGGRSDTRLSSNESVRIAVGEGIALASLRHDPAGVRLMTLLYRKRTNLAPTTRAAIHRLVDKADQLSDPATAASLHL